MKNPPLGWEWRDNWERDVEDVVRKVYNAWRWTSLCPAMNEINQMRSDESDHVLLDSTGLLALDCTSWQEWQSAWVTFQWSFDCPCAGEKITIRTHIQIIKQKAPNDNNCVPASSPLKVKMFFLEISGNFLEMTKFSRTWIAHFLAASCQYLPTNPLHHIRRDWLLVSLKTNSSVPIQKCTFQWATAHQRNFGTLLCVTFVPIWCPMCNRWPSVYVQSPPVVRPQFYRASAIGLHYVSSHENDEFKFLKYNQIISVTVHDTAKIVPQLLSEAIHRNIHLSCFHAFREQFGISHPFNTTEAQISRKLWHKFDVEKIMVDIAGTFSLSSRASTLSNLR